MRYGVFKGIATLLIGAACVSNGVGQERPPMRLSEKGSDPLPNRVQSPWIDVEFLRKPGGLTPFRTASQIHSSLRQVINTGADLFNLESDYHGCYRLFQGSLLAVKPLLEPGLQTRIDAALSDAAKRTTFAEKANRLRLVLDEIRIQTAPTSNAVPPPVLNPPAAAPAKSHWELIRVPPQRS